MLTVLMERTRPYSSHAGGAAHVPSLNAFRAAKNTGERSDTVWQKRESWPRTSTA